MGGQQGNKTIRQVMTAAKLSNWPRLACPKSRPGLLSLKKSSGLLIKIMMAKCITCNPGVGGPPAVKIYIAFKIFVKMPKMH